MKDSICRFLPPKSYTGNIKTVHFVYETDFKSMLQPFIKPIYYLHLVTSGEAVIRFADRQVNLSEGSLFFFFPAVPYEIDGSEDFRYVYISFMGAGVAPLLDSLEISLDRSVLNDFGFITEHWLSAISRINNVNANVLTESVLLYTLSFIPKQSEKSAPNKNSENLFDMIVDYVDTHFRDKQITLRAVADIFSYTEKYLSHFFKTRMNTGFNEYLNSLRIQYAHRLIGEGFSSVSDIADLCGFADPLYFSKVFKKKVGYAPSKYIEMQNRITPVPDDES